ncbi:MAG TPA: DUF4390 domain-containing protein [Longimicrobiales bacterium]|nr:DUF4390 domain-containing protein [Longimicrobiales bacterium]
MLLLLAVNASAQRGPSLSISHDLQTQRGVLRLSEALADRELEDAVRSGLPLRVRFRAELWKDAFLDEQIGAEEWTLVLTFDALSELYIVRSRAAPGTAKVFTNYKDARAAIEGQYNLTLRPGREGRFYYTASVDIETLSLSDLDELERWLKGELQPAVTGDRSIPGAIGQGARRLFMRVLSLPERRFEARSDRFRTI